MLVLAADKDRQSAFKLNSTALAAYGLTLKICECDFSANVNTAKGSFDGPRLSYTINANDQLLTSEDYRPLIVAYNNGAPVWIEEIAQAFERC